MTEFSIEDPNRLVVAFVRPLAPAAGHIIVRGERPYGDSWAFGIGHVAKAVALCGASTERAGVDVAVVAGRSLRDVDCKRCLAKYARRSQ